MLQIAIGVSLVILATILHGSRSVEAFQIRTSNPKRKIVPPKKSVPAKKTVVKTIKPVVKPSAIPASVIVQGFQSYQNPYNSSPAVQQSLEFRLGQNSYSKQVQNGWLM
jgi:hypothetical protein